MLKSRRTEGKQILSKGLYVSDAFPPQLIFMLSPSLTSILIPTAPSYELLLYERNSLFLELCKFNTWKTQTVLDRQFFSSSTILLKFFLGANKAYELSSHLIGTVRFMDI